MDSGDEKMVKTIEQTSYSKRLILFQILNKVIVRESYGSMIVTKFSTENLEMYLKPILKSRGNFKFL